jgi:hypothetical protein
MKGGFFKFTWIAGPQPTLASIQHTKPAHGVLWARKNPAEFASLAYRYFPLQISQTPLSLTQS